METPFHYVQWTLTPKVGAAGMIVCHEQELGMPRSLSSIVLFRHNTKLQLSFSSLAEKFMVSRASDVLLYSDSADTKVSLAGLEGNSMPRI